MINLNDPWIHRSKHMSCITCMWFVAKAKTDETKDSPTIIGRCRRHSPSMGGYPVVFMTDWCGDHRVDENKI